MVSETFNNDILWYGILCDELSINNKKTNDTRADITSMVDIHFNYTSKLLRPLLSVIWHVPFMSLMCLCFQSPFDVAIAPVIHVDYSERQSITGYYQMLVIIIPRWLYDECERNVKIKAIRKYML